MPCESDSLGFGASDADLYRYAGNGATNNADPSGNFDDRVMGMHPSQDQDPRVRPRGPRWTGLAPGVKPYRIQTPFDSSRPRRYFKRKEYFHQQFTPGSYSTPDGIVWNKWNLYMHGCAGMVMLRLGITSHPGGQGGPGVWFNDPAVAWNYWNSLTDAQQNSSVVVAVQSDPYPYYIVPIAGKLGFIKPGFWVGGYYNYATWQLPFWDYANNGSTGLSDEDQTPIQDGRLSQSGNFGGPPIIGIIPSEAGDRNGH
jgi:hypothetical protein